jgi:hypothetical protein
MAQQTRQVKPVTDLHIERYQRFLFFSSPTGQISVNNVNR